MYERIGYRNYQKSPSAELISVLRRHDVLGEQFDFFHGEEDARAEVPAQGADCCDAPQKWGFRGDLVSETSRTPSDPP